MSIRLEALYIITTLLGLLTFVCCTINIKAHTEAKCAAEVACLQGWVIRGSCNKTRHLWSGPPYCAFMWNGIEVAAIPPKVNYVSEASAALHDIAQMSIFAFVTSGVLFLGGVVAIIPE